MVCCVVVVVVVVVVVMPILCVLFVLVPSDEPTLQVTHIHIQCM